MSDQKFLSFPEDFTWGVATSSYQIEGAYNEDGRGLSIWDTFCRTPGKTHKGERGDTAADHYHRWADDIEIMKSIGLQAYRFSIAWPRIQPDGKGKPNQAGLDFYDRLVDALLEAGIEPFPTLYHWDLPQALQDEGGWANRETASYFADYASIVAKKLGDRVSKWITHNEPWVMAMLGHMFGQHAPGIQDPYAAGKAVHYLLLSHGYAVDLLREGSCPGAKVGITLNLSPVYPFSESTEDRLAAVRLDTMLNKIFLHPLMCAQYPEDITSMFAAFLPEILPGDMEIIARPIDFLGVNYYNRTVAQYNPDFPVVQAEPVNPEGNEYSQMWEIYPEGFFDLLERVHKEYHPETIYITENGICVPDGVDFDNRVRDYRRIDYLQSHIAQVHRAIQAGVPVKGYMVWSLLDNFEWAYGYQMRFGLVYVDFDNQKRIIKDSGNWYGKVIENNGICITET